MTKVVVFLFFFIYVLKYKQNPDAASKIMEEVAHICNIKYDEYLLEDKDGVPVEPFKFNQITKLNVNFIGHQFSLSGLVKETDFVEASKNLRYELAKVAYTKDLRMADSPNIGP